MQVATAPYSASLPHTHYHPYYQLPPPGPQDHDLKRQYLALLPPQQIIEICLTFDVHVPPYIKSTIWPLDLNAAIAHLQSAKNAAAEKPPEQEKPKDDGNAMNSLQSPQQNLSSSSEQQVEKETEPRPPDKQPEDATRGTPAPSESISATSLASAGTSPSSTENHSNAEASSSTAAAVPHTDHSTSVTPAPQATPTPVPAAPPTQPTPQPTAYPYPYAAQYPQPQYYAGGYAYPYAAYPPPPPMQAGYAPAPPPAPPQIHQPYPTVTQTSIYNNVMPIVAPGQDGQVNPDDLPSYEEMIVEALTDCPDAEGWAPKDLFTWMAKRYPLQSNFRPSASQALQKAFKRGRFEKSSQGKYRLSASWEGGNTSRRTTRRPQTHPSIASQPPATPSGPPFTHAPLVHHGTAAQQQQPGYPAQPYGYQFQQQPIAYTQPPAATPVVAPTANPVAAAKPAETTESADAYEAAKTILNAINFGDLLKLPADDPANATADSRAQDDAEHQLIASGVENLLSHVQAALANNQVNQPPMTAEQLSMPGASSSAGVAVAQAQSQEEQMGGPRAELQAQLALLAAQLAELSQTENAPPPVHETAMPQIISPLPQPIIPVSAPAPSIPQVQPQPEIPPPMSALLPPPEPMANLPFAPEPEPSIPTAIPEPEPEPAPVPEPEPPLATEVHEDMDEPPLVPLQPQLQLEDMEDSDEDDEDMEEVI